VTSKLERLSDDELKAQKARTLAGLRAIFIEEWRREVANQSTMKPESAIPQKGAAGSK